MSKLPILDIQMGILAIQIKVRKIFFRNKKHHNVVISSLQGHFHFFSIFSSLLWNTFLLTTLYQLSNERTGEKEEEEK